jgi:alanyl-tRNA synthetase
LLAAVGAGARTKVKAGDLVKELSVLADGRGGGRPDRAQAGSKFPEKEAVVLAEAQKLIRKQLGV